MGAWLRKCVAVVAAIILLGLGVTPAQAQTKAEDVDGPFAQWGLPTPPGAEGYEVNQVDEVNLDSQGLDSWEPTQQRFFTRSASSSCGVYWPALFQVCGAIKQRYDQLGGPRSFLMLPKSHELTNPDGVGKRSEFVNGFIYWHPHTGAHSVSIPVSVVWQRHGWEQGFLGYPVSGDQALGGGWFMQSFQGGHVFTRNTLPAVQSSIQGAIYEKWQQLGAQHGELGYPISDELVTPDGRGRYNVFEGGMIYWTPEHGAYAVNQGVLYLWAMQAFEQGDYGYPIADSFVNDDGDQEQSFEGGVIYADAGVFWQPYSCANAVGRIAAAHHLEGQFDFMCSDRGVSLTQYDNTVFELPTLEDLAVNFANERAPMGRSRNAIECDITRPTSISEPIRRSNYHVARTVELCIGEAKKESFFSYPKPVWAKEFVWQIDNVLKQRQYGDVRTRVSSMTVPELTFEVKSRQYANRKIPVRVDEEEITNIVDFPRLSVGSTSSYEIPRSAGRYHVLVESLELKIPSWNYHGSYRGLRFSLGNYNCPKYERYADLCVFSEK